MFLSFDSFLDVIIGKHAETEVLCTKSVEPSLLANAFTTISPLPSATYRVTSARSLQNAVPFGIPFCFANVVNLLHLIRICGDYLRKFIQKNNVRNP